MLAIPVAGSVILPCNDLPSVLSMSRTAETLVIFSCPFICSRCSRSAEDRRIAAYPVRKCNFLTTSSATNVISRGNSAKADLLR